MSVAGARDTSGLGLRKLGRDVTMNVARQIMIIVIGLASTILLARVLGPSGNGQYAVAMLLPTVLATFLNFGIGPANVYFIGRGEVSVKSAVRTTLSLWVTLSVLGCIIGALVIEFAHQQWFHGVPKPILWLAALAFPVVMLRTLLSSVLQAIQDFVQYNKILLAAPLVTLVLTAIALLVFHMGVGGALVAMVIGSGGGLSVAYVALKPHLQAREERIPGYGKRCLSYGWKAHLSNILSFFNYRADVFLLNYFLNPAAAGIYMIAVQLAERLWTFSEAVSTVLLPLLSGMHQEEEKRKRLTPLIARWLLLLSAIGAVILILLAQPLIHLLFGDRYAAAGPALLWLLPGIVLGGSARVLANDLAARGRPELNLITAVIVVTVNIVGNIILIPKLGIVGASIATTASYGLNSIIKLIMYSRLSANRWTASVFVGSDDIRVLWSAITRWRQARRSAR